ncbi:MAG: hypothetical protein GWO23_10115 [Gammaproteobacteria bacterium]|nr:hypothetical protein [Gammaproteobacteria bacterium]NIS51240.1 hypothetical protein [Phycisphaerae bacterium]NIW45043.1 hypothetical protein [Gammaproteobacteria bacterium]NIW98538.1 hypothetical protein [Phycisphaerae bacterium]
MAITYDAVSTGSDTSTTTVSATHTCAGSDRCVVVVASGIRNQETDWSWSTVTYDGESMTKQQEDGGNRSTGRDMRTSIWTLLDPPTTASATVTATASGASILSASIAVISFANVSAVGASNVAKGTSTAPSVSVTTTVENSWLVGGVGAAEQSAVSDTPGTGVTERWDFEAPGNYTNDDHNSMGGHRAATTTGSYAFAYTIPDSDYWQAVAVEITPIPVGGGSDLFGAVMHSSNPYARIL